MKVQIRQIRKFDTQNFFEIVIKILILQNLFELHNLYQIQNTLITNQLSKIKRFGSI